MDTQSGLRANAERLFFEGCRHLEHGRLPDAESCLRKALALVPDFGEALTNLAYVLDQCGDTAGAQQAYTSALEAGADSPQLHLNLGALLASQKRYAQAQAHYHAAIRRAPHSPAAWSNLGALHLGQRQDELAEHALRQALSLDPNHVRAQFNLSYLHLRHGRFEKGWRYFEARNWYAVFTNHFDLPRWSGEPLQHKSLVVVCEAGHGDAIHFARYVPLLHTLGVASITLVCHPALKELLGTLDAALAIIGFDEPLARTGWDFWTPLMSLPYRFQTRGDTIPAPIPYLSANPERVRHWQPRLPHGKARVGLAWKGNPQFHNDADRSLPHVTALLALWRVRGVDFLSLQKGAGEDEAATLSADHALHDIGRHMENFSDAAAIVSQLDLVICVDTAIAHLAGALGCACWVMLPNHMPDWRWGVDGSTTPWYPHTMRLFRQEQGQPWGEVVGTVAHALEGFLQRL